jgi:HAT1-interacting factor 1
MVMVMTKTMVRLPQSSFVLAHACPVPNDPRFTFGGDTEDEPVHLSELKDEEEEEPEAQEQAEEDGEEEAPEDDFNAAWEVLELARVLYEKQKDEDDEIKLKLADTYLALGDVSTETGWLSKWLVKPKS